MPIVSQLEHPQEARFEADGHSIIMKGTLDRSRWVRLSRIEFVDLVETLTVPHFDGAVTADANQSTRLLIVTNVDDFVLV